MVRIIDPLQLVVIVGRPYPEIGELSRKIRELTLQHKVEIILPRASEPTPRLDITPRMAQQLHEGVERLRKL